MLNPRIGQLVRIRYRADRAAIMPLHDRVGRVVVRSRGRPRNHGVEIGGAVHVVPCGNINKEAEA